MFQAVVAALALASGVALAHDCPNEMKAIDAELAAGPKLAAAELDKAKTLLGV